MQTPLGPTQSIQIREVSLFPGLFNIRKIHSGPHAVSAIQWMSLFQGCSQGGGSTVCSNVVFIMEQLLYLMCTCMYKTLFLDLSHPYIAGTIVLLAGMGKCVLAYTLYIATLSAKILRRNLE